MSRQFSHLIPLVTPTNSATHIQVVVYHSAGSYKLSVLPADVKPNGIVIARITQGCNATLESSRRYNEKRLVELFHNIVDEQLTPRSGMAWKLALEVAGKAGGSL
jgi:hypothetical protein